MAGSLNMAHGLPVIELEQVTRVYGKGIAEVRALRGIDLQIFQGEFVAVMGPSGSGKSTVMNILGCLDTPSSGYYRFLGQEVGNLTRSELAILRREYIGFVFQGYNLLSRTSAIENVELPLIYRRVNIHERHRRARESLDAVGLVNWEHHTPAELSGGQQQRVAIARALVSEPALLLADEPTGNLDTKSGIEVMGIFEKLNALGRTIILVTHEPDIAGYARRVIHMRDGLIVRDTGKE